MGYPKSNTTRDSASKVNTRLLDSKSTCNKNSGHLCNKGRILRQATSDAHVPLLGSQATTATPSDATTTLGCSTRGPTARWAKRSSAIPRSAKRATTTEIGAASSQMATRDPGTSSGRTPNSKKWACVRSNLRNALQGSQF